jgi:hypothetical protein
MFFINYTELFTEDDEADQVKMQPNIQFIKLSRCLLRVYYHNAHKIFQRQPQVQVSTSSSDRKIPLSTKYDLIK